MGTALRFNEEARALFVARALVIAGFGVLWTHDKPGVVMTSASQGEVAQTSREHPGTAPDWYMADEIDASSSDVRIRPYSVIDDRGRLVCSAHTNAQASRIAMNLAAKYPEHRFCVS